MLRIQSRFIVKIIIQSISKLFFINKLQKLAHFEYFIVMECSLFCVPYSSVQDFTQIRIISEGCHCQGPGKRMDDGAVDVGVAETSMEP
jgi:hypothetical protein